MPLCCINNGFLSGIPMKCEEAKTYFKNQWFCWNHLKFIEHLEATETQTTPPIQEKWELIE